MFVCDYVVGSDECRLEVRNGIADMTTTPCELVPLREHLKLQAQRVKLVVYRYWLNTTSKSLLNTGVKGCDEVNGYDQNGKAILGKNEDMLSIDRRMQLLVAKCGCKGDCNTRQCSCIKRVTDA